MLRFWYLFWQVSYVHYCSIRDARIYEKRTETKSGIAECISGVYRYAVPLYGRRAYGKGRAYKDSNDDE